MEPDTTSKTPESPDEDKQEPLKSIFQVVGTFRFKPPKVDREEQTVETSVIVEAVAANEAALAGVVKMGEGAIIKAVREIGIGSLGGMMG